MRTYEATILVDANAVRADKDGTLAAVRGLYETEGAEFIEFEEWEERKLAYQIRGQASALYINAYLRIDPAAIERIERRVQLSELVLRHLLVVRDGAAYDKIRDQRAKAASAAAAAAAAASEAAEAAATSGGGGRE